MKLLVMLQNAWAYRAADEWDYQDWLGALYCCHSGRRLRYVLGEEGWAGPDFHFCNTTPRVGEGPNSVLPADPDYVRALLAEQRPDACLACGTQAEAVLTGLWDGPLLAIPHPANRFLTNALLDEAKAVLAEMAAGGGEGPLRVALRQRRGTHERVAPG